MVSLKDRPFQRYSNGCRQVVGCIPYRFRRSNQSRGFCGSISDEIEVLLISSQKGQAWLFPKGGWEIDESMEMAAKRETLEEAGVVGDVKCELGMWRYKSKTQEVFHEGYMFSMLVEEQLVVWQEGNMRRRMWMTVDEAREKCPHWWMKEALESFVCQLVRKQEEEESLSTNCLLEFLRTEDQRVVAQKGTGKGDEEVDCCQLVK
ncbi:nudix hydrolase 18, mitochondrial-like [Impatiens glandulifera]|uniref:nudix hydrolase 18, mitochondrial-like n=1 Tax=Impatiens glandulifera TaxID=253017 RepID=UPI001FB181B8|nr:nudix hydrolase 18, mitochondrial-like [Impatiens glandulifera]